MTRPPNQSLDKEPSDSGHIDERFADWVDGRLKPAERAALEAEMASDPTLRRAAEDYRRCVQVLRSALAPDEMGESVADAVMAAVAKPRAHTPRAWRPYLASAVAAAALVLVFVVVRSIPPASDNVREVAKNQPRGGVTDAPSDQREFDLVGVQRVAESAEPASAPAVPKLEALAAQPPPAAAVEDRVAILQEPQGEPKPPGGGGAPQVHTREKAPGIDLGQLRDILALGELALVVDVAARQPGSAPDANVGAKHEGYLGGRQPTNGAELLAAFAPAIESKTDADDSVDLRRVSVVPLGETSLALVVGGEAAVERGKDALAQSAPPPILIPRAGDRVFRVAGSLADVRAFSTTLQTRVLADRGRFALERYSLAMSSVDKESERRRDEAVAGRGAVASGVAKTAVSDRVELLLVLRGEAK